MPDYFDPTPAAADAALPSRGGTAAEPEEPRRRAGEPSQPPRRAAGRARAADRAERAAAPRRQPARAVRAAEAVTAARWPTTTGRTSSKQGRMPLLDHLIELRNRLMWSIGAILVAFLVAYQFKEHDLPLSGAPAGRHLRRRRPGRKMIFTGLTEAFFTYVKVSFWAAICLAFPIVAIQIWKFVAPGLYKNEKRRLSALSVRDAGAVLDGRVARLFRRDPVRVPVLPQLRDAGRSTARCRSSSSPRSTSTCRW